MNKEKLYPLKFKPILMERIWGGNKLISLLNKNSDKNNIGESWELSGVDGAISIVANGYLKGKSLNDLLITCKGSLVGERVYREFGNTFPLLIKFIDAREALSIQLHPDDELAGKRHHSFGKSEMWYIMQADKGGNLIVGFKRNSNKDEYLHHLQNKSLLDILNVDTVKKGDVYFIPAGRVHAIGAGVLLAEIQQTSDITYRIYDWDRVDQQGNSRELHTDWALDAINYKAEKHYNSTYSITLNKKTNIVDSKYFTTNIIPIQGVLSRNHADKDSFVIYICVAGTVNLKCDGQTEKIKMGETLLVPATIKAIELEAETYSELLEVYIK
ncbi:MAG: class I mannose-6-phosphate isomerase [Flavobacteriaceae bacterium]|nr:class I mannose-6-phosphate isomerase [Flavobacteriaceae bacterium]